MKRKVTQIGRFFAMAALLLGAASWADAQTAETTINGKNYRLVKEWDFNSSWAEDSAKFATYPDIWAPTMKGDTVQRYATKATIKHGQELAFDAEGTDLIGKTKGLIFTNLENDSKTPGWKSGQMTFRVFMDPGLNCIQVGKKVKLAFAEVPATGSVVEIVFQSANATARGWDLSKCVDVEPLFEGDADAHDSKVESRQWVVTGENPSFSSNNGVMLHQIRVYNEVKHVGKELIDYEYETVKEWDFTTPWTEDSAALVAATGSWTAAKNGEVENGKVSSIQNKGKEWLRNNQEWTIGVDNATPIKKLQGLYFKNTDKKNDGGWAEDGANRVVLNIGGDRNLTLQKTGTVSFYGESAPQIGQYVEIAFKSGNGARGIASVTGMEGTDGVEFPFNSTGNDTTLLLKVTGENPSFTTNNNLTFKKITIKNRNRVVTGYDSLKVAYLGDKEKVYEPAYEALVKAAESGDNYLKVTYLNIEDYDNTIKAEAFKDYDVLVTGSTQNPGNGVLKAIADSVIGKMPVLSTRAYWYGSGRFEWATANGSNANADTANYVTPELAYVGHPVFAGLVDPESLTEQKIVMFDEKHSNNPYRYMQGYPDKDMKDTAPAHTVLGTSAKSGDHSDGKLKSIAEAWVNGYPYMLVGIDIDLRSKGEGNTPIYPNAAGNQLLVNAVGYVANATEPFPAGILGTCSNPVITFEKVKADGTTDSDTLRYVVHINVDKVKNAKNESEEIYPTVTVTIGSAAAKAYDFEAPDTIWEPCTVKAKATADLYLDSEEVSAEFKNEALRTLAAPEAVFTKQGETVRNVLTFKETTYSLDGKQVAPTIKYSLDGSENLTLTYDPLKPDTVWETTQVKAQASLYLHLPSAVSDTTWRNPDVQAVANPTIVAEANADYPGGCLMTVTITTTTEGADIYYTLDGSQANRNSYRYENPFYVENIDSVTIKAIAVKDLFTDSEEVVYGIAANTTSEPLAVPTINITDNSFEITGSGRGDIYYTMDGSEPSATNGLKYTDKVTYLSGSYTIKAIAQGYGYKPSAASEGTAFNPTAEAPVFGKTIYKSTFNRNDPSVKLEDDPDAEDHTQHVWGWFRWVPETPGPGAGETGPWMTTPNKSGDPSGGNTYLSGQELADGVYYDSQTKPRPNIFINNEKGGWRHFNNWVFYKDPAMGSNGKYRRILVQENMSVNGREGAVEGATGGALYIFNSTPKATAGPEIETFKGPFAVVVNISGAEKFNESGPASSVNVCAANAAMGSNEMVLGTVSCEEKKMGTDTIRYYGDEKVYLRLATEASELLVYDFIVYGPGIDLPALKVESITPAGGNTQAEAAPLEASTKEFRVTFNNEITLTEGAKATFGLTSLPPTARAQCTLTLDADKKTVIITPEGELTESGTYALRLEEGSVVDGDDQKNEVLNVFYTVSGVSAIDEVSAAKEVVATHIYSISGAEIPALKSGVNFVKKIYSDGSVTTEKVQVK